MNRIGVAACALCLSVAAASAQAIDLSKPYGDKYGCINRNGQEVAADEMLLLTSTEIVTAASACEITGTKVEKDGSLTLSTMCESEGEEASDPVIFTVSRGKSKETLVVADQDGNVFGQVSRCR